MTEGAPATPIATKRVKLWLDADLIEWFKTQQGGARGYQTKINAALRKVVEGERRKVGGV